MSHIRPQMSYIDLFQERNIVRRLSVAVAAVAIFGMAVLPHGKKAVGPGGVSLSLNEVRAPFTHVGWHPGTQAGSQAAGPSEEAVAD